MEGLPALLPAMLAQRPILEGAGMTFDEIGNYEPLWKIESAWRGMRAAVT